MADNERLCQMQLLLTNYQKDELERIAQLSGKPQTQIVREALSVWLNNFKLAEQANNAPPA